MYNCNSVKNVKPKYEKCETHFRPHALHIACQQLLDGAGYAVQFNLGKRPVCHVFEVSDVCVRIPPHLGAIQMHVGGIQGFVYIETCNVK